MNKRTTILTDILVFTTGVALLGYGLYRWHTFIPVYHVTQTYCGHTLLDFTTTNLALVYSTEKAAIEKNQEVLPHLAPVLLFGTNVERLTKTLP